MQCIERERGIYYNALREKERERERGGGMHYNAEKERKEHFIIDCERDFRHLQVPKYLQHVFKPNKRYRKPKGQSRIDNPEKLATLVTQDTG